jgi:hypothetical protein
MATTDHPQPRAVAAGSWRLAAAVLLALLLAAGLLLERMPPEAGASARWMMMTGLGIAFAHLTLPLRVPARRRHLLAWAVAAAGLIGCALAVMGVLRGAAVPRMLPALLGLSGAAALLSLLLEAAAHRWSRAGLVPAVAAPVNVLALLAAAAAPVWLGPWAEATGSAAVAGAVVACSPLSYLAAMLDHDYLRGQWFYAHSPLGGLRFAYPDPLGASAACLALSALLAGRSRRRNPSRT